MLGRIFIFIFLLGCFTEANATTLDEALAAAYEHSPTLKAKREELKATDELLMRSLAELLPDLSLRKIKTEGKAKFANGTTVTDRGGTQDSLYLTQNLFRGGRDISNLTAAKYKIEHQRAILLNTEQEFLSDVVKAFLELKGAEEKYTNAQTMVNDTKQYVDAAEQKFKIGAGTKTDIARAKAAYSGALSNKIQHFSNLLSAHENFKNLTGIEVTSVVQTADDKKNSDQKLILPQNNNGVILPKNVDEALTLALKKNPGAIAAENASKASSHEVKASIGELMPSVDLQYSVNSNKDPIVEAEQKPKLDQTTSIQVTVPVFDGGAKWSNVRQKKAINKQRMFERTQTFNDIKVRTIAAWTYFESAQAILKSYKEELEASRIAYQGAQEEEKAGLRASLDVIIARREFFQSFEHYVNARTQYYQYLYGLKSALGECTAKDLKLKVKPFDPLKNYNSIRWQLIGAYN